MDILQPLDWATLILYFAVITALGLWMGRTIHTTTDFFVGGRRFGKLFSIFHTFGTGTHSDQAVSVASKTYTNGMSGIWYQWQWMFCTPFYWWIAGVLRRCRAITAGDYFQARYNPSVAMLFVVVGMLNLMINIGVMLKGSGAVIAATTGDAINTDLAIAIMTILFVVYGVVGGLSAAVVTDFVQGLMTILFSFILLPFAIQHLGGFATLHARVIETYATHPAPNVETATGMWSLVAPGEITAFYIAIIAINALVGFATQPHNIPQCNASRDDKTAQWASVTGNMIKRFCTVAWTLLGMCAFVMFAGMTDKDMIDKSFGLLAAELLPKIAPGLIGIFIASLLAAVMSSCDSFMVCCSGLFTQNLYRPFIAPGRGEGHYVTVGRIASAVVVAGGVFFAYRFESVVHGLEIFWKISAMMGIAFWAGLFWRRATPAGAWAGTLASFAVLLLTSKIEFGSVALWDFNARYAARLPEWMVYGEKLSLPIQMIAYLSIGLVSLVFVSLLTRRQPNEQLDRFFEVIRTPVQPGEVIDQPVTLPANVPASPPRKLINLPDWEIQIPTARGWIGFFVTWLAVGAIIALVVLLVNIGA